ncbi:MAG: recombinase family protein [Actinomyces sp.]|nr:recombinase family protein [Actinomyces sp.]
MALIGYARVSTADQNPDRQVGALEAVDRLFADRTSGEDTYRPEVDALRSYVREGSGDIVRVKSIDRLARSTQDLLSLLQEFAKKGVGVEFIETPAQSTSTPSGKFTLTVLAAVAEFERELIRERQRKGIAMVKAKGNYRRGPKLSPEQIDEARRLVDKGVSKTRVADCLRVSRWTVNAALAGCGVYAEDAS